MIRYRAESLDESSVMEKTLICVYLCKSVSNIVFRHRLTQIYTDFTFLTFYRRNQTNTVYKQELDSLLTLQFQRFEKAQVVAV